jgi:PAS domain S-box-containing protein
VSFNAAVFRDTAGQVVGILAAARDITEQKRIELELREQQAYTRSLIESNIDALMTTDPLGIITDVNRQMCAATGSSPEELVGTPFKNYFTDPGRAEAGVRQVLAEDKVTNYELTIRAKDGRENVVSYNATTFRDADGRLKGVFAAARDITDQKRLEGQITQRNTELTETTTFLNNVLESSTEYSIIAKDLEGNVLTWNEGARRNYGYSAEEMVGKGNTALLYTPEDLSSGRVQTLFEQALATGKAEGVFDRQRKAGGRFTASVSMTLRRDASGTPIGYLLISKDITEQKRLEEQLQRKNEELEEQYRRVQEANRLKSQFLANMSHELRTPLNAIIGFSELMHDGKVGPVAPDHKEYLGDILTSGQHLLQLINDVLDLAKVESGKMEFYPEPVNLAKITGEVRDVLRTLITLKRINVTIEVDAGLADVSADGAKLKQVLYNYLSNALKFTPEDGKVTLRVQPAGAEYYRIEVEDSGIGIKTEDTSRLFLEFQQLDGGMAKKHQGTGLGLALTKRIVEAQGGQVGVTSVFGKGSVFYAVLPRAMRAGAETAPSTTVVGQGAPTVLIVDGDPNTLRLMDKSLTDLDYRPLIVPDGAHALSFAQRNRPDAVILDLIMPGIDGFEFLRQFRRIEGCAGVPVIVWTVKDVTPSERKRLRNTAQAIIAKGSQEGIAPLLNELRKHLSPPPPPPTSPIPLVAAQANGARKRAAHGA